MSCPSATAPINIQGNTEKICNLKCAYGYKYPLSSVNVSNQGDYLKINTDRANTPPVTFNKNSYEVTETRLYYPSLHEYGGTGPATAELIIAHSNVAGKGNLLVCIPITVATSGSASSDSVKLLNSIIAETARSANTAGQQTVVNNLPNFSLNAFVPMKAFYSYTGTLPYAPCNGEYQYVVFTLTNNGFTQISPSAFTALKGLVNKHTYTLSTSNTNGVYYNPKGPSLPEEEKGDFYMSCEPVGSSGETLVPNEQTSAQMFDSDVARRFLQNGLFQFMAGIILMVGILKLGKMGFDKINKKGDLI
jgi:carbonic anhydrase